MVSRQTDLLVFIRTFTARNGYPPTIEEMRAGLGWSSKSMVAYHLADLEESGQITRTPKMARTIRVVKVPA